MAWSAQSYKQANVQAFIAINSEARAGLSFNTLVSQPSDSAQGLNLVTPFKTAVSIKNANLAIDRQDTLMLLDQMTFKPGLRTRCGPGDYIGATNCPGGEVMPTLCIGDKTTPSLCLAPEDEGAIVPTKCASDPAVPTYCPALFKLLIHDRPGYIEGFILTTTSCPDKVAATNCIYDGGPLSTNCPNDETLPTNCYDDPDVPTYCPDDQVLSTYCAEGERAATECSDYQSDYPTHCLDQGKTVPTKCPDGEVGATVCEYDIPVSTNCPDDVLAPTQCYEDGDFKTVPTLCVTLEGDFLTPTYCPDGSMINTLCPEGDGGATFCPNGARVITICPDVRENMMCPPIGP